MVKEDFVTAFDKAFSFSMGDVLENSKKCKNDCTFTLSTGDGTFIVVLSVLNDKNFTIRIYKDRLARRSRAAKNTYPLTTSNIDPAIAWIVDGIYVAA